MHTISLFSVNSEDALTLINPLVGRVTYPAINRLRDEVYLEVGNIGFVLRQIRLPAFRIRVFPRFIVALDDLVTGLKEGGTLSITADIHNYSTDCSVVRKLKFTKMIKE